MGSGVSAREGTAQRAANKGRSCCFIKGGVQESNRRNREYFSPSIWNRDHLGVEPRIVRVALKEDSANVTSEGESADDQKTKPHCIEREFESLVTGMSKPLIYLNRDISSGSSYIDTLESYVPPPLTQVLPRLYLGSQEDAEQEEKIMNLGITHIISIVGGGRYSHYCENHMYIPLRDNGSSDLLVWLDRSYNFMIESQKPHNKLFIHCQLGQNRSASLIIGFLMRYWQCCLFDAYTFIKEKRELIHPNLKYMRQLRELDFQLNSVYSTPKDFLRVSLSLLNGINVKHENYSKVMSTEFMRFQSKELVKEDSPATKETIVENLLVPRPADIADSKNNTKYARRSFTISRTRISHDDNAIEENNNFCDNIP